MHELTRIKLVNYTCARNRFVHWVHGARYTVHDKKQLLCPIIVHRAP
jgi:hypothetical protein